MVTMNESRKLAAILAADVVGYSRLTGADEDRTLARLRALRSDLIDPTIAVHNGRVVKRTGDGALVEFRSVVDAVRCAVEVQNAMVERNAGLPVDAVATKSAGQPSALPDKPSIAVLPFTNMSGDPEQEYFVDGMVEDIITALSRFSQLFVIARNSTFTYKGRAVDVRQVAKELGVRYVLEGGVRKSGSRLRIT